MASAPSAALHHSWRAQPATPPRRRCCGALPPLSSPSPATRPTATSPLRASSGSPTTQRSSPSQRCTPWAGRRTAGPSWRSSSRTTISWSILAARKRASFAASVASRRLLSTAMTPPSPPPPPRSMPPPPCCAASPLRSPRCSAAPSMRRQATRGCKWASISPSTARTTPQTAQPTCTMSRRAGGCSPPHRSADRCAAARSCRSP